ncbi:MAG: hypothetical protein ACK4TP_13355 [Hyphomicrobium sp.]
MADAVATGDVMPAPAASQSPRTVYAAGGGRKFAFSFVFLLLLPFFISLPSMLFWRISQGHWNGTLGLVVLAVGFTFIMFLVVIELMHSLMARIELGEKSVKMTLPSGRGPTPIVRYRSHDIPYDQIKAVETRREIYGGSVAPVLLQGARLILKDDSAVKLGYVSEANSDPCFPYPEIAQKIAERAGLSVEHKGNVRRSLQKKYLGLKHGLLTPGDGTVEDSEIEALNKSHRSWVMRLITLLVVLVVSGIALDIIFPPSSGLPPALTSITKLVTQGSATSTPAVKQPEKKK